jgi:hypothetical protein
MHKQLKLTVLPAGRQRHPVDKRASIHIGASAAIYIFDNSSSESKLAMIFSAENPKGRSTC